MISVMERLCWPISPTTLDLHGSHPVVLTATQTTLIPSNTTQVYLKSSCAFTCMPKHVTFDGINVVHSHRIHWGMWKKTWERTFKTMGSPNCGTHFRHLISLIMTIWEREKFNTGRALTSCTPGWSFWLEGRIIAAPAAARTEALRQTNVWAKETHQFRALFAL